MVPPIFMTFPKISSPAKAGAKEKPGMLQLLDPRFRGEGNDGRIVLSA
jgi:hypothetical protein